MTKALVDEFGHDLSPNKHTQIAIQEVENVVLLNYILKMLLSTIGFLHCNYLITLIP